MLDEREGDVARRSWSTRPSTASRCGKRIAIVAAGPVRQPAAVRGAVLGDVRGRPRRLRAGRRPRRPASPPTPGCARGDHDPARSAIAKRRRGARRCWRSLRRALDRDRRSPVRVRTADGDKRTRTLASVRAAPTFDERRAVDGHRPHPAPLPADPPVVGRVLPDSPALRRARRRRPHHRHRRPTGRRLRTTSPDRCRSSAIAAVPAMVEVERKGDRLALELAPATHRQPADRSRDLRLRAGARDAAGTGKRRGAALRPASTPSPPPSRETCRIRRRKCSR